MSATEVGGETPAKLYVCPACGNHYDEPTTCSNGHEPTQTIEYDRATFEAAQAGDAAALASVAATALAAGNTAGVSVASAEAAPMPLPIDAPPPPPTMVIGDAQEAPPFTPAAPVEPVPAAPVEPAPAAPVEPPVVPPVEPPVEPVPVEPAVVEPTTPNGTPLSVAVETALAAIERAVADAKATLGL